MPRLAALALAMVAAPASYGIHANRSAGAQDTKELVQPAGRSGGDHRSALHAHRKHRKRHHTPRRAHRARKRPIPTTVVVDRVVQPPCARPREPPDPGPPHRTESESIRAESDADRKAERDVDRELQRVIDQDVALRNVDRDSPANEHRVSERQQP